MGAPVSSLVRNERTKLLANALDRASTAALAVGVLGPVVTSSYGLTPPDRGLLLSGLVIGTILWVLIAVLLHVSARWVLKGLR
jgi:hypothetical protein